MQIKKVVLNNYRSHSHIEVAFSKGINLILGKNGRGKIQPSGGCQKYQGWK